MLGSQDSHYSFSFPFLQTVIPFLQGSTRTSISTVNPVSNVSFRVKILSDTLEIERGNGDLISTLHSSDILRNLPDFKQINNFNHEAMQWRRVWVTADNDRLGICIALDKYLVVSYTNLMTFEWNYYVAPVNQEISLLAFGIDWVAWLGQFTCHHVTSTCPTPQSIQHLPVHHPLGIIYDSSKPRLVVEYEKSIISLDAHYNLHTIIPKTGLHNVIAFQQLEPDVFCCISSLAIVCIYRKGIPIFHPVHLTSLLPTPLIKAEIYPSMIYLYTNDKIYIQPIDNLQLDEIPRILSPDIPIRATSPHPMQVDSNIPQRFVNIFQSARIKYNNIQKESVDSLDIFSKLKAGLLQNHHILKQSITQRQIWPSTPRTAEEEVYFQSYRSGLSLIQLFGKLSPIELDVLKQQASYHPQLFTIQQHDVRVIFHQNNLVFTIALELKLNDWKGKSSPQQVYVIPKFSQGDFTSCQVTKCDVMDLEWIYCKVFVDATHWNQLISKDTLSIEPRIIWKQIEKSGSATLEETLPAIQISKEAILSSLNHSLPGVSQWPWWCRTISQDYDVIAEPVSTLQQISKVLIRKLGYRQAEGKDAGQTCVDRLQFSLVNTTSSTIVHIIPYSHHVRICFRGVDYPLILADLLILQDNTQVTFTQLEPWNLAPVQDVDRIGLNGILFDVSLKWQDVVL